MLREVKAIGLGCDKRCWWKVVVKGSKEGIKGWM